MSHLTCATVASCDIPVVFEIIIKLILKLISPDRRPSRPIPQRIPRLDHKLRNDTMEDDTLVVPAARVANEILHRFRCLLGEQPKMNVANSRVDSGGVGKW